MQDPGITSSNGEKHLRIVVLGGKLQGVEAVYLAQKAGWETRVIDRHLNCPAAGLCDVFTHADIRTSTELKHHLKGADLLIPALENSETLTFLKKCAAGDNVPVLFDFSAYALSSSKTASNRLFHHLQVPAPLPWPACGFPVVVKPSFGSGSRGVRVFHDASSLREHAARWKAELVMQQFIDGPLFSIEVVGRPGTFAALQTTELEMDSLLDCRRVSAPTDLPQKHLTEFESIAVKLAESLSLQGLMDVEAVFHDNTFKILEIDARFPSQTPSAVWWSTGVNLLALLADCFLPGREMKQPNAPTAKGVIYEHIQVKGNLLESAGEHIMAEAGVLHRQPDFFGADDALTNYHPHRRDWAATLINTAETRRAAWKKRNRVVADIRRRFALDRYVDDSPRQFEGK